MDAKDLRTESAQSDRTKDGETKYTQDSALQQCNRSKPYQDIGSSSLGKVDAQAGRPCAVIGPDRVVPPPAAADTYLKKTTLDPWPCVDAYRRPLEHPHKMNEYHLPNRNISPRQTFQENMQRIMLPASYNLSKIKDNYHPESNITSVRNNKLNLPTETKYCEVPYAVNSAYSEQKTTRTSDINVPPNNTLGRSGSHPHGWVPSNTMRSTKPYGVPEIYQYPDPSSCGASRPMFMPGPQHRPLHEEPSHMYSDTYYQESNLRFKPYPSVKDRVQQVRYEYLGNYTAPFQPSPFPSHKHELQKSMPSHAYSGYPQVPLKYLDTRLGEAPVNAYQRPINQQPHCNNVAFRNPVIHPTYASVPGNLQANKFYYPPENPVKNIQMTRLPYDTNNKVYMDYDNFRPKPYGIPEGYYFNENRSHNIKSQGLPPQNFPIPNVQRTRMPMPYYRSENPAMKGYEYNPHIRNFDPSLMSLHNNTSLSRFPSQFSPNNVPMSPSDSNPSSDTNQIQGLSQEEASYASQSASANLRNSDTGLHRMMSDPYGRYDYRYGVQIKHSAMPSKSEINSGAAKSKKDIDVRQFLQMWNEGEDDGNENNKEVNNKHVNTNDISQQSDIHNQEQLYVLGLVNVPREELGKYEHIEKVSKLPENIKGYNSIELLNQFEEVIESSKLNNYNPKLSQIRDARLPIRTSQPLHGMNMPLQAVNVIPHGMHMPPRPLSPLDVEAKISQSVIHKEVGCNFEIKPCSPKILNVEIAAPVQTLLGERVIEKVSNSVSVSSVLQGVGESESCKNAKLTEHNMSSDENLKAPSCKMISNVFNDNLKTNYSLHDLESNSGVCLASLPRLDNDCELNFPEVNQQFINANKETVITSAVKDLPTINVNSPNVEKRDDLQTSAPDQGKGICKLSKYRKLRNKTESDDKSHDLISQNLRTDSVIIKNPDNVKIYEETSEGKRFQLPSPSPINLALHNEDRINNDIRVSNGLGIIDDVSNVTTAIDYSAKSNDVSRCEMSFEKLNEPYKQIIDFDHHSKSIMTRHEMISNTSHTNISDKTLNITQKESINTTLDDLLTTNSSMDILNTEVSSKLSNKNDEHKNEFLLKNNMDTYNAEDKTITALNNYTHKNVISQKISNDPNSSKLEEIPALEVTEEDNQTSVPKNKKLIPGTEIYEEDFSEMSGMSIPADDKNKTDLCIYRKKAAYFRKETFSPQIQFLLLHTEGLCIDSTNEEVKQTESDLDDTNSDSLSNCSSYNFRPKEQINLDLEENYKEHFTNDDSIQNGVAGLKNVNCSFNCEKDIESIDGPLKNNSCSDVTTENISEDKENNLQNTEIFSSHEIESENDNKITSVKVADNVHLMETETISLLKLSSEYQSVVNNENQYSLKLSSEYTSVVNKENQYSSLINIQNNVLERLNSPSLEITPKTNALYENSASPIKTTRDEDALSSEISITQPLSESEVCEDSTITVQKTDINTFSVIESNYNAENKHQTSAGVFGKDENKHHSENVKNHKTTDENECCIEEETKLYSENESNATTGDVYQNISNTNEKNESCEEEESNKDSESESNPTTGNVYQTMSTTNEENKSREEEKKKGDETEQERGKHGNEDHSENEKNHKTEDENVCCIEEESKLYSESKINPLTGDVYQNISNTNKENKSGQEEKNKQAKQSENIIDTNKKQLEKENTSAELNKCNVNIITVDKNNICNSRDQHEISKVYEHKHNFTFENNKDGSKIKSRDTNNHNDNENFNSFNSDNKPKLCSGNQNNFNLEDNGGPSSGIKNVSKFPLPDECNYTTQNTNKNNSDNKGKLCANKNDNFGAEDKNSSSKVETTAISDDKTKHTLEDTIELKRDYDEHCSDKENNFNSNENKNLDCSSVEHRSDHEDINNLTSVDNNKYAIENISDLSGDNETKITVQGHTVSTSDVKDNTAEDKSKVSYLLEHKSVIEDMNEPNLKIKNTDDKYKLPTIDENACDVINEHIDDIKLLTNNKFNTDNQITLQNINNTSKSIKLSTEDDEEINRDEENTYCFEENNKLSTEDVNELSISSSEIGETTHGKDRLSKANEMESNKSDKNESSVAYEIKLNKIKINEVRAVKEYNVTHTDDKNKPGMVDEANFIALNENNISESYEKNSSIASSSKFSAINDRKINVMEKLESNNENKSKKDVENNLFLEDETRFSRSENKPDEKEIDMHPANKNNFDAESENEETKKIYLDDKILENTINVDNIEKNEKHEILTSMPYCKETMIEAEISPTTNICDKRKEESSLEFVKATSEDEPDNFVHPQIKSSEQFDNHRQIFNDKIDSQFNMCSDTYHNSQTHNIISSTTPINDVYSQFDEETIKFIKIPAPVSPTNMLESEEICEYRDIQDNSDENVCIFAKHSPGQETESINEEKKSTDQKTENRECLSSKENTLNNSVYELNVDNSDYSSTTNVECCEESLSDTHTNLTTVLGENDNVTVNITLDSVHLELEECCEDRENFRTDSTENNEVVNSICASQKELKNVNGKYLYTNSSKFGGEIPKALSRKRKKLKRSLSDSALNICTEDLHECDTWAEKRKRVAEPKKEAEPRLITENFSINLINNRRNSVSSIYTDENVSFCILIDDNCIIAEENDEEEKICYAEIPEEFIEYQAPEDESNDVFSELASQVVHAENSDLPGYINSHTLITEEERVVEESWFDDVACVETVVSEDISDDVIVSAMSSPINTDVSDHETENNYDQGTGQVDVSLNYHSEKVKHIYGDKMCSNDAELVDTLYRTPQMDMNKTLISKDSSEEGAGYYNSEIFEDVLSESCTSEQSISPIVKNIQSSNENTVLLKANIESTLFEEKESANSMSIDEDDKIIKTQDDTVNSCESSVDVDFRQKACTPDSMPVSSSPEVSSTTEEKNSTILLKITNYGGSRIAEVNNISHEETKKNTVSCKYTEKREYLSYDNNLSRPLITKAAKKYIPPLEDTVKDLKVKLRLPQKSLNKLKLLKVSKEEPKPNLIKSKLSRKDNPKKSKPKFEDVLKSIDEIQYKMHKEKSKKVKKTIPKVVIKKCENGSHYASSADREKSNPDLTGQKWQPWVFLERNRFIDKMATQQKTKAVYSHRKSMYILAETFKKYKSAGAGGVRDAKHSFVISQPTLNDTPSGKLKYTIRLKQAY